jgi:hypothetical protein
MVAAARLRCVFRASVLVYFLGMSISADPTRICVAK